ncbi:acyl-CoA synthetase [Chryseotalea sanaruensis]|uniref:Acyl-CoA synthetase n=1 Tax=Chryseotalea sanaruensis TaxID=2482724 RepID=A0A401U918_9BACT|nr:AMP-binding protein [Chryseotalea sanaruensis]GCC51364.1 acyl-CoA synthetase [Chryseotalea sanaruensis]
MHYTHTHLSLNNKSVALSSIQQGSVTSESDFEKASLDFIHRWLNNQQTFILQTSGSTGTPKKIEVTREQLIASASATIKALELKEHDQVLICLSTQYIAGIMMLVRCLVGNLNITAIEPTANPLNLLPPDAEFDFAALVPYQAETMFTEMDLSSFKRIKKIIIGGAPVSLKLTEILSKAESDIYQTYGMTETLSHIALQKISGVDATHAFKALPGVTLKLDARNCLVIQADYLPEAVVANDVVEMIGNNTFRWLGRADNVINSGGIKLYPEKLEKIVEHTFSSLSINNRFFVCGTQDAKLGTAVSLIIESANKVDEIALLQQLRNHLQSHELPKVILYTKTFEMTPTNKINRVATLRKYGMITNLQ